MATSKYDSAISTLKSGGTLRISSTASARLVFGQIVIYNPSVTSPSMFSSQAGFDRAKRNGDISVISNQQLAAALGTTVTSSRVPNTVAPKVSTTPSQATTASTTPLNGALATLRSGGTYVISPTSYARLAFNQIVVYNPQVISASGFIGSRNAFDNAKNNGSISVITQSDLAAAINSRSGSSIRTTSAPARTSAPTTASAAKPTPKPVTGPSTTSAPTTTQAAAPNSTATIASPEITVSYTPGNLGNESLDNIALGRRPNATSINEAISSGNVDLNNITNGTVQSADATQIPETLITSIATEQDQLNFQARNDWRVRLALSPDCNYLYRDPEATILSPLSTREQGTDGVIFPYTPQISVSYTATYNPADLVHTNYKVQQYNSSSVETATITADFTAQDAYEARYLLAVIHFFRSVTKMFYGKDSDPRAGTPPPLCYLFGMGSYQFSAHPLAVTAFTYNLPADVDYIKTTAPSLAGVEQQSANYGNPNNNLPSNIAPGGRPAKTNFSYNPQQQVPTYVPTHIQLIIGCIPIMSRNQVSNYFSVKDYATGKLYDGTNRLGGGMW